MIESELILAVVKRWYPPTRFAVCDRVSWGFGLNYEADAMALSKTGVLHELEAKSTKTDLVADLAKYKWKLPYVPDLFWYVVPPELADLAIAQAGPRNYGVVVVSPPKNDHIVGYAERVLKAKKLGTVKYGDRTRNQDAAKTLYRLATLRYWEAVETRMQLARENESLLSDSESK